MSDVKTQPNYKMLVSFVKQFRRVYIVYSHHVYFTIRIVCVGRDGAMIKAPRGEHSLVMSRGILCIIALHNHILQYLIV